MAFTTGAAGDQRIELGGDWRQDGGGALQVSASHIFLETLEGAAGRPARYGGVLDAKATIRGTRDRPTIAGDVTIVNGRIRRVSYQKLAGHVDYSAGNFAIDFRVDEAPGAWLTAKGTVPTVALRRHASRAAD